MNRTGLAIALAIAVAVGVIFAVWPRLDLDISALFYNSHREDFIVNAQLWVTSLRDAGRGLDHARRRAGFSRRDRQDHLAAPAHADRRPRRLVPAGDAGARSGHHHQSGLEGSLAPAAPDRCRPSSAAASVHAMVGSARALRRQLFLRLRRAVGRILDAARRRRSRRRNGGRSPMAPRSLSAPASGSCASAAARISSPTWSLPACSCSSSCGRCMG